MIFFIVLSIFLGASAFFSHNTGKTPADYLIHSLPGLSVLPSFNQYSGYIEVSGGRMLFFWFTEAKNSPSSAPVVMWNTGGPGCSSLLAFLTENGPFRPEINGSLKHDPWSWNDNANVIWIEQPVEVGFSYCVNVTSDCLTWTDDRTANDSYTFFVEFFKIFKQFAGAPVWITGESYGGHYVPELTDRIVQGNNQGLNAKINLQGLMVGNAWTWSLIDNYGAVMTWAQRALLPTRFTNAILKECQLNDTGPLGSWKARHDQRDLHAIMSVHASPACQKAQSEAMGIAFSDVNIYDIYIDECHVIHQSRRVLMQSNATIPPDPCVGTFLIKYLNDPAVQKAIHARPTKWSGCSGKGNYSYSDIMKSVIPVYESLLKQKNLNILVYSGDVDAIVPYWGSQTWVYDILRLPVKEQWRAWHVSDKFGSQVGGFVEVFDGNFTFATVRNAGHEVPFYQAKRAYYMFNSFMTSQRFPK